MSFHGGYNEIILFDFWKTESVLVFVISCIILFVSAALYEGIKLLREKLVRYEVTRKRQFDLLRSNASQPIRYYDFSFIYLAFIYLNQIVA